jgi:hypothetical protein
LYHAPTPITRYAGRARDKTSTMCRTQKTQSLSTGTCGSLEGATGRGLSHQYSEAL